MHLDEKERQDYHEQPTSSADSGATWMVIGVLLWISDLIAFLAVGFFDLRVGHRFVLTWVVLSGIGGVMLILSGWLMQRRAAAGKADPRHLSDARPRQRHRSRSRLDCRSCRGGRSEHRRGRR